jgi:hypothetical protein
MSVVLSNHWVTHLRDLDTRADFGNIRNIMWWYKREEIVSTKSEIVLAESKIVLVESEIVSVEFESVLKESKSVLEYQRFNYELIDIKEMN